MTDEFETDVAGIAMLNDGIRRTLYRFVAESRDAVTRDQAAEAAGVQRALAAFHLDKMAEAGLLDVEFRRLTGRTGPGAGRPSKLYKRSSREIDVSLPPREYDLAAHLLAAAIEGASGKRQDVRAVLQRLAYEFGERLGDDAERRAGTRPSAAKRRDAVIDVLREHGFEPRVVDGEVVLANCPFHSLSRQFTDLVCGMNLQLMQGMRSSLKLRESSLVPRLDPSAGMCCVRWVSGS